MTWNDFCKKLGCEVLSRDADFKKIVGTEVSGWQGVVHWCASPAKDRWAIKIRMPNSEGLSIVTLIGIDSDAPYSRCREGDKVSFSGAFMRLHPDSVTLVNGQYIVL